jgi:hypothetical protein
MKKEDKEFWIAIIGFYAGAFIFGYLIVKFLL